MKQHLKIIICLLLMEIALTCMLSVLRGSSENMQLGDDQMVDTNIDKLHVVADRQAQCHILQTCSDLIENGEHTYLIYDEKVDKYGLIDLYGEVILKTEWDRIYRTKNDRVFCERSENDIGAFQTSVYLFDVHGSLISFGYLGGWGSQELCYEYANGIAAVHTEKGDYYIDLDGVRISNIFFYASGFENGYAIVKDATDSDYYIIDTSFSHIVVPEGYQYSTGPSPSHHGEYIFLKNINGYYLYSLCSHDLYGPYTDIIGYGTIEYICLYSKPIETQVIKYYKFWYSDGKIDEITEYEALNDW